MLGVVTFLLLALCFAALAAFAVAVIAAHGAARGRPRRGSPPPGLGDLFPGTG